MMDAFEMSRGKSSASLPGMFAEAKDKHLIAHMIPINLTRVQESGCKLMPDLVC